jgi:hypothetical protein
MVSGVAGAAGPAATGVNAFVQVVLDDLAQEVAGLVVGFSRRGGGFRHPVILGGPRPQLDPA